MTRDAITVLECAFGCRATKLITPAGISDYAAGTWFATTEVEAAGIGELAKLLDEVEHNPRWFIIRGRLIEGRHPGRVRRLLYPDPATGDAPYFEPRPCRWVGLDFDSFALPGGVDPVDLAAVATLAIARLPGPFRRVSCWAQLTSGAGIKPGGRVRLFYWLDRPAGGAELKRWLRGVPGLDPATLNDVTPNYVARPIFVGLPDPVPVRSKLIAGEVDEVAVQIPPETARCQYKAAARNYLTWRGGRQGALQRIRDDIATLAAAPPGQRHPLMVETMARARFYCAQYHLPWPEIAATIGAAFASALGSERTRTSEADAMARWLETRP